jgi:hypothetical protein
MSKTWKEHEASSRRGRTDETPQKAIDRLVMREAEQDIREALTV